MMAGHHGAVHARVSLSSGPHAADERHAQPHETVPVADAPLDWMGLRGLGRAYTTSRYPVISIFRAGARRAHARMKIILTFEYSRDIYKSC
jgi:hypothetical protein